MSSKWCPRCGKIISTSGVPNFCTQGCGSLADEPILPPYSEWTQGYEGMVKYARVLWEEKQKQISKAVEISPNRLQMRLF